MLPPSPRPANSHCSSWTERFILERETLRRELAQQIRCNMANLVGHAPTADVLLVAADGHKFPAHLCILRKRAPNFFHRYVQIALEAIAPGEIATRRHRLQFLEVAVGDVDSNALGFFIRSIYTEEEVSELGHEVQHQHEDVIGGDEDGEGQNDHYENRGGQFLGEMGHTMLGQKGEENAGGGNGRQSHQQEAKMEQLSVKETNNLANQASGRSLAHPMTSFLELAGCAAAFGGEGQMKGDGKATRPSGEERGRTDEQNPEKENRKEEKKMFPIFIGIDGTVAEEPTTTDSFPSMSSSIMAKSLSSTADASESPLTMDNITITSMRGRAIARRRLSSVSSLNSLCSVDVLTPTQESTAPFASVDDPQKAASKLAADLLQIYAGGDETTAGSQIVLVETKEGTKLKAPLGTLWANSEYFRDVLSPRLGPPPPKALLRVSLSRFSSPAVQFLLQFLHGGLCCLPPSTSANDLSDVWELFELGAFVRSQLFIKMLTLNVRAMLFHFFHRPCVACVSAVFDALPKMELEIPALRELFDDALQWQAANFTRIWKGRVFLHLSDQWQQRCRDALLQSMDEENVVDVLLACEKLQVTLPRLKSASAAHRVLGVVADVEEYCLELIRAQFDLLISSRAFRTLGKGLALNLSLLEDILPPLVHSLSADTAIRAFIVLKELLAELDQQQPESTEMDVRPPSTVSSCDNSPSKRRTHFGSSGSLASYCRAQQLMASEWNPRFKGLCHRMANLLDRHMLHFAGSILDSDEWGTLDETEQDRIRELGLFVEVKMPRAPLPRLSSFGRLYKRSSSLGIGPNVRLVIGEVDRTQSLERKAGHATVTSRPSLSTQMEEETATMNDGGEINKDGSVEEKGRMTDRNGEEKGEKGRMTDRNGEEKGEKGRMTDRNGEEKGRMTDRNGEEKGEKGRMTDRNGEEKGEKGRMTDRNGEEKGRMTATETVPLSDLKGQSALLTSKISSKSLLDKDIFGISTKKPKSSQKQQKTECPKTVDSCVEKEKRSAPSAKPAEGAVEAQVQDVQKVLLHGTPEKAVPSASSLQQAPPVPTFDRQRTHIVMTVEENVRAGIAAYLDALEQPTETGGISKKPQSIVRPMPQQKTAEGVHRISSSSSGVGAAETSVDHRRTSRTAAKKTPMTARSQMPSVAGCPAKKRATTERDRRTTGAEMAKSSTRRLLPAFLIINQIQFQFHSVQNIPFEKLQNHSRRLVRRAEEAGWIAAEWAD